MGAEVMKGKSVLITGANSGIGKVTAEALAGMGARVILACRRQAAAETAMEDIRKIHPQAQLDFVELDLSSQSSVRRAAREMESRYDKLDVLINNAGIANVKREETADGYELTFATNHLGPFLLTNLLLSLMEAAQGRIINVASESHRVGRIHWEDPHLHRGYWVMKAYAQSKLANILFTHALARRIKAKGVTVNALHPGAVSTQIWPEKHWYERLFTRALRLFLVTPEKGARTSIWLASSTMGARVTGSYFENCKERKPSAKARDDEAAERLWALSKQLTGVTE